MMKGGLGGLMKQAQQMQQNMQKAQAELAGVEVEGLAGNGMVKVIVTCGHEVRRVIIDDSLMSDDKEMLEDLLVLALNDAMKKAEATTQQRMGAFTAGMGLPPGMKLPF
jgi:DNA-binding YbaB/EbfC family protein